MNIYLDYAAATPVDPEVKKAMEPYFSDQFYNPSATYLSARAVRRSINEARTKVAGILGAKPAEIIFTAGATEANNLAVAGISRQFPDTRILVSAVEHESVLGPARRLGAAIIPVNPSGVVRLDKLKSLIDNKSVLISIIFTSNELGTIQPLKEISAIVKEINRQRLKAGSKLPLYLHTDATQAANFLDLSVSRLGVDLMSLNSGKIYGPKGSGCLYVRAGAKLQPLLEGGGQEFGIRSGTENVPGIVGFAEALVKAQAKRRQTTEYIGRLRQLFEDGLTELGGFINGGPKRMPHIISVSFPGQDNERLMIQLDEAGIECAVGSACSAENEEPSHVLKAIGLTDEMARATLRFSLGKITTEKDIRSTLKSLSAVLPSQQ